MAINTQPQFAPEPFTRPSLARVESNPRWHVSLGMGQLIVLWSTIAGVMVAVFIFGVYSGREQGFKQALDDHSELAVRLPIEKAIAIPSVTDAVQMDNSVPAPAEAALAALTESREKNAPDFATIDSQIVRANEMVARLKRDQNPRESVATDNSAVGFKGMAAANVPPVSESPAKPGLNRINETTKLASLDSTIAAKEASAKEKNTLAKLAQNSASMEPAPVVEAKAEVTSESQNTTAVGVAAKVTAPLAEEKKIAPVPGSGWIVQIAAEKSQPNAQQIMKKLKGRGFSAQIEKAVVNKTNYFRVLVGPYPSKQAAADAQRKLLSGKLTRGASFLRRVG